MLVKTRKEQTKAGRRSETTAIAAVIVVVAALALGYFGWRQRVQTKAHGLLAVAIDRAQVRALEEIGEEA